MPEHKIRSNVTIKDKEGNEKQYRVEAFFDLDDKSYALLTSKEEDLLMRIEGDELIELADNEEIKSILGSYQSIINSLPDSDQSDLRTK